MKTFTNYFTKDRLSYLFERNTSEPEKNEKLPETNNITEKFTCPAEFEQQEAVWVSLNDTRHRAGEPRQKAALAIIQAIAATVKVKVPIVNIEEEARLRCLLSEHNIDSEQVEFVTMQSAEETDPWLRDHGPVFVRNNTGKLKLVDFRYTFYGEQKIEPYPGFIRGVDNIVASIAKTSGLDIISSQLASEGGNHDFNGKGTMLSILKTELQRNPGWSKSEIEHELCQKLGQQKIIWLPQGLCWDDKSTEGPLPGSEAYPVSITGGHIDELARFVDSHTIVLAEVSEQERDSNEIFKQSYYRLEECRRILEAATDQDGKPFRIIRLPVPDLQYGTIMPTEGDRALSYFANSKVGTPIKYALASSYLNFLITNGAVVIPKYWMPGKPSSIQLKDEQTKQTIKALFPARKVIAINAEPFNHGGGGIHCNTQQEPKGEYAKNIRIYP